MNYNNYQWFNKQQYYNNLYNNNDRFFGAFAVPFLLGGLGGAAVVGLSRPRPVFVNQPYPYGYPYYRPY